MARRILKLRFDRVDVVDRGANHNRATGDGSHILLMKRDTEKAVWSTAYVNDLPDSSFALVDGDQRHLPYKDASGKVDAAHVRNALARLNQVQGVSAAQKAAARRKLVAAARGVGVETSMSTEKGLWGRMVAVFKAQGLSDDELTAIEKANPLETEPPKKDDTAMTEQEIAKRIEDASKAAVEAALKAHTEAVEKKAKEEADTRVAKAEADAKAAMELAKKTADERDLAKFEAEIRSNYPHLTLDPAKDNAVLKELAEKLPEVAKRITEIFKSANENLRLSKVLAANGDGSPQYTLSSTFEQMEVKAKEYMAKGECTTIEAGLALVSKREPDLAARYAREQQERVRKYSAAVQ